MSLISVPFKFKEIPVCPRETQKCGVVICGTCNSKEGYALSERSEDKGKKPVVAKSILPLPKKKDEVEEVDEPEKAKKEYMKKRIDEFNAVGVNRSIYGKIQRRVLLAAKCTDELLDQRRRRLREMLLAEEAAFAEEYVAKAQKVQEEIIEEMKRKDMEIQLRMERDRLELVKEKRLLQNKNRCDEARPFYNKKKLLEIKEAQYWQIRQKNAIKEAEREQDKMWHDLMIKNMLSMKERDEEDAKKLWGKQQAIKQSFDEQMAWKRAILAEEEAQKKREMEELIKANKNKEKIEQEEREKIREKNIKATDEIRKNLLEAREVIARRSREEKELELCYHKLQQEELKKELQAKSSETERLRREMQAFRENMEEMKLKKLEDERKCDEFILELNMEKQKRKDAEKAELKKARDELVSTVMKERAKQLDDKKEQIRRENELRAAETELMNLQMEQYRRLREDFEKRSLEERLQYGRELQEQIQKNALAKKREQEEIEDHLRLLKLEEEEYMRQVKELIAQPLERTPHPFKKYMFGHDPKFVCPFPCETSKNNN